LLDIDGYMRRAHAIAHLTVQPEPVKRQTTVVVHRSGVSSHGG
jgi:hypothetical protein